MPRRNTWIANEDVQKEIFQFFAKIDQDFSTHYERFPRLDERTLNGRLVAKIEERAKTELHQEPFRL